MNIRKKKEKGDIAEENKKRERLIRSGNMDSNINMLICGLN